LSHFPSSKVLAKAKFATLKRLKRDKSAAKLIGGVGIARRCMFIDSSRSAAGAILARAIVVTNAGGDQR